jgi:O-antigen/teichoic acid export membrane protein
MSDTEETQVLAGFSRDFGFYSLASIFPTFLGFVALVVFTRVFDSTAYGRYALTIVFVTTLSTGLFGWLRQSVLRFESDSKETVPTAFALLFGLLIVISTIGVVFYLVFGGVLGEYRRFYFAGILALAGTGMFQICSSVFQARLQSKAVMRYRVTKATLRHGLGLFLAIFFFGSIVGWVWGMAIGSLAAAVGILLRLNIRTIGFERSIARQLTSYGVPMIGWLFGLTLLSFIDRVLVEFLLNTSAVGIYSANYQLVQAGLPLVLAPIIEASHPAIMQEWDGKNEEQIGGMIREYSRYFLILGVPATIFAAAISRPLSHVTLGTEFHSGFVIIPVIALALFFWHLSMLGHKGLEVQDKTGTMTVGIGIAVAVNIGLNYIIIPMYGYLGAAVATLVSTLFYSLFAYFTSRQTIHWTVSRYTLFRVGISGVVMTGISLTGYFMISGTVLMPVLMSLISGFVYALVLSYLGEFTDDEIKKVKSTLVATFSS